MNATVAFSRATMQWARRAVDTCAICLQHKCNAINEQSTCQTVSTPVPAPPLTAVATDHFLHATENNRHEIHERRLYIPQLTTSVHHYDLLMTLKSPLATLHYCKLMHAMPLSKLQLTGLLVICLFRSTQLLQIMHYFVSDIDTFVLKRDAKLRLTNSCTITLRV